MRQLVDQATFDGECAGLGDAPAKQLCFVAFLPHILDSGAEGRNKYIEVRIGQIIEQNSFCDYWLFSSRCPNVSTTCLCLNITYLNF